VLPPGLTQRLADKQPHRFRVFIVFARMWRFPIETVLTILGKEGDSYAPDGRWFRGHGSSFLLGSFLAVGVR